MSILNNLCYTDKQIIYRIGDYVADLKKRVYIYR